MSRPHSQSTDDSSDSGGTILAENPPILGRTPTHPEELIYSNTDLRELAKTLSRRTTNNSDPTDTTNPNWQLEKHLRAFIQRAEEQGLPAESSQSTVLFKNVVVRGQGSGATYQDTVKELLTGPVNGIAGLFSGRKEPEKTILHGIDGVIRDGEMVLVLGRPGSGCSTMLKTLAGLTEGYEGWSGEVTYNGVPVDVMKKRFRGDVVYNPEVDTHFPHLNVGQTLSFAAETHAPSTRLEGYSRARYVESLKDVLATTFGLRHTLSTKVGDDFVRGVSGGERKRVSIAEMLATKASVGYWDNSTRGLDASTSLEFAQALRAATNLAKNVAVVAIYQAGENLTQLFDKVTVLYLGRQIFFGSLLDANSYFQEMGFYRGPRQTTADFLTAITDPNGREVREGWENRVPRTPVEFVQRWKESKYYKALLSEMDEVQRQVGDGSEGLRRLSERHRNLQAGKTRKESPYKLNIGMQLKATIKRSYQRIWGDKAYLAATTFASIFMSLINGSVFVNLPDTTSGFFSKGGVMFFAVLFNAMSSMSEITTQYAQRPIVQKQKSYAMYHPFTDALSSMFADWPIKFLTTFVFDLILYFMTNLKREAGAFFIFVLFTYISVLCMGAIFRTVAAATKKVESAMSIAGVMVLALAIYAGYVIPRPSMHPWFKWISYINPLSYAFEALMTNEFHNLHAPCSSLVPSGLGYTGVVSIENQVCAVTGSVTGQSYVLGDDYLAASYDYHFSHMWRNFGILVAFWIFFVFTYALATEINSPAAGKGEFLIFRKGHEPEYIKRALESGKAVEDVEGAGGAAEVEVNRDDSTAELEKLVKSRDMFTWENVCYDIVMPNGKDRRLLDHIQGFVKPGTMTALMGESGAGKTTLLNVLAQRIDTGVITGDILVNGSPLDQSFQRRTGYVQQQDLHLAESTVREALRFSALLRQPKEVPLEEKYEYVETVIKMLEMEDYASAVIGTPGSGLNVEQRKRTTIGVELVAKPALLLFLDEPTSGLDSQSAWSIVKFLQKLAASGQAILCTIHQPSAVLFEQFDRLLLLKKGGQTVYFGDIGKNSRTMIDYFERNGGGKCDDQANPAEYILDVIGAGATAHAKKDWHDVWNNSTEKQEVSKEIGALKAEYGSRAAADSSNVIITEGDFAAPWVEQYFAVQKRLFQHYWRSPIYIMGKLTLNVFAGLFLGFTFYKEKSTVQGLQNKLFAIFMATVLCTSLMNQLQPRFIELTKLYAVREKPSKMYHWSTFVLSNIIVEIPFNFVCGTLFFLPWYYAVGFWQAYDDVAERGIYMWYLMMVFNLFFSTFGQVLAALAPNEQTAATLTTLLFSFVIIFNGVLQPVSQLVGFWHWMYHLSPFTYLISGLMSNVIHDVPITCATLEINVFQPPAGETCASYIAQFLDTTGMGKVYNPDATADCQYCRYSKGDEYLKGVNMSWDTRWRNSGFLWVYVLFNASMVFLAFYLTKVATMKSGKKPKIAAKKSG
ncbi:hypothetical protein RUND412_008706 [Rhizina undulata]